MNFRQFLSVAASAAIMLTSVTAPNVTAETAVLDIEPNTRVSVTVTDPQTTTAPDLSGETVTTTTMRYADGGDVGTAPDTTQEYVPTETVTTCVTTTSPIGTGGWNPPPYMTTTAVSNVLLDINNDKLKANKYDVTVDQYGTEAVYFEKHNVRADRLYTTCFDNDEKIECHTLRYYDQKDKDTGIDGVAYKMLIRGKKPGTTKVLVQEPDGDSCIINVTVKAKDAPEINNKLKALDSKDGEELTVDISGHDHKYGGVTFKEGPEYIFAQVLEGNDDLKFGMYTSATIDGVYPRVEISTNGNGAYKVLFTDNDGNNMVATVNVSEAPYADPYPDQPIGTEVPNYDDPTTTTTTTMRYADGGDVGTAPQTTPIYIFTTTTDTTPAPVPEATEDFGEPTFVGDADLSGDFGLADITSVSKFLLSKASYNLSRQAKANADINRDKKVDSVDVSIMIELNLRPEMLFVPPVDIQPVNTEVVITPPVITTTTDTNDEIIIIGSAAPYINNNVKLALKEYISNKCNNFNYNSVTFGLDKRRKIQKSANDNLNYIGDEYYFNLYYKGIMLNPEKYQINEKFYDDGTYTVTGNFVDDSFMERLNSIDLDPILTENNAVSIAKEYVSGIDVPDIKEGEKVFLEFGQFYPTEQFGKEISLIIYSVENSILTYKICDTDMNYNDVKPKDSSVSDFIVNIAIYVDAQTEQVINHHFSIDSIVT